MPTSTPAPAPALIDDVLDEIFLRFPPDEPAGLVRAASVCKLWRRLLSAPNFNRRYRLFHGTPPMLGFLHRLYDEDPCVSRFVPTTDFRPPRLDLRHWYALDARHGRALFYSSEEEPAHFVVWDPIKDGECRVPQLHPSPQHYINFSAAVLCAADGCDHLGCHGGPFLVVFVGTKATPTGERVTSARVYSSEAGAWSDVTMSSVEDPDAVVEMQPSVLVGNALYFICQPSTIILRYDLVGRELTVIKRPDVHGSNIVLMTAEDGALGFTGVEDSSMYLWSREVDPNGAEEWLNRRVVELERLLPPRALFTSPDVIGFAEGVGVVFVRTNVGIFSIEIKSGRVRKVSSRGSVCTVIPYMSFCTPGPVRMQ